MSTNLSNDSSTNLSNDSSTTLIFPNPSLESDVFTIYSINACPYCEKVKKLLINEGFQLVEN